MKFVSQPAATDRIGEFLLQNLSKDWDTFRAAVAFVKRSGVKHIASAVTTFSKKHVVEIVAGIDHRGTSKEGLSDLLKCMSKSGRVIVFNNPSAYTFHPKVYLFKSNTAADVLVGSGNLTEGGIYSNYEASFRLQLDLTKSDAQQILAEIEASFGRWTDLTTGCARRLDQDLLSKLAARGDVPPEALINSDVVSKKSGAKKDSASPPLFKGKSEPSAPKLAAQPAAQTTAAAKSSATPSGNIGFVMVLQNTDVGTGQTTPGTTRRSPEVFIPLKARDTDAAFWRWPNKFVESATKWDRTGVKMRLGAQTLLVNMMCWKLKKDFRLRHEALRSGGSVGDILRIELAPLNAGFEYLVDFVPKGTTLHPVYLARCTVSVANSKKTFGYY
jgi:HKD family nuclease